MENLLSNNLNGFIGGNLFLEKNVDFLISEEVFKQSNANYPDSHMTDIFNYIIKNNLKKNGLNLEKLLNNLIIVVAHGKSDRNGWIIYATENDKGTKIENFIKKLPKNKKILLYVCNFGGYKINLDDYSIIYPQTNTGVQDLKFYIQGNLVELL